MSTGRRLSLVDCIAIGINGIIGSGIFLLPRWVANGALAYGAVAFIACGVLCFLVALCYAEVGGMTERSGGTYVYAREAFGDEIGFGVGWLVLVSAVLGYATVARGLGDEMGRGIWELSGHGALAGWGAGADLAPEWVGQVVAVGIILFLATANWWGVKTGARTSDILSLVKLGPLLLFVLFGLFFIHFDNFRALGTPTVSGFAEGTFSALFALSGFEFVAVVAGETDNPRRNIPLAIVGSLVGAVVLYAFIQAVVTGVLPTIKQDDASLVETARLMGGTAAADALRLTAIVSMLGFCAGSALVGPQLVASLAQDGVLPRVVTRRHGVRQSPHVAIVLVAAVAMVGVTLLDFKALADLTIVTLFAQYVPTCLAVIVFRRWKPDAPRSFRVPFGALVPMVALVFMGFLVTRIDTRALYTSLVILAVGVAVIAVTRSVEDRVP